MRKDRLTKEQRSYCMSRVRGKNTSLETVAFSTLRKNGLRFRKHVKDIPGKPDAVLLEHKITIFIDGDFWHGYRFENWKGSLSPFWRQKIQSNMQRDRRNFRALRKSGWGVVRVWGHEMKRDPSVVINKIARQIWHGSERK